MLGHVSNVVYMYFFTLASHQLTVTASVCTYSALTSSAKLNAGPVVSIPLNVTTTSTTEFSLSLSVIVHVSVHALFGLGVYVNVVPFIAQLHKLPFDFTPLKLKSLVPQSHSLAFDDAMNCANVMFFGLFQIFHVAKVFAVGATLLNVYVAVFVATFPKLSVTYHVIVTVHGVL